MVFTSPWFWGFFVATLVTLALPFSVPAKKRLLTLASCLFYAAWDARYLLLLLSISVVDYVCARSIHRLAPARTGARRGWLLVSLVSNLGALGYFKYADFFIQNANLLGAHLPLMRVLLPAGISFYTFKTMSYVIDVYRGTLRPCESWLDYAMFITFFPELIAGPIVRASVFLPQMERKIGPTRSRVATGGSLFLVGFSKKVMADRLGTMVTPIFANPQDFDRLTNWLGLLGYSLQIYLDFSGYSDMAIGCAKCIGYDLPENFRMPYLSRDITEFWRRWHITLSTWLRDYLYIPLGGNRRGPGRTYLNLMATMLLGGLWHGASWNFVLWGGLHGAALAVHRLLRDRKRGPSRNPVLATAATFLFVSLCWIPFRCPTFRQTSAMFAALGSVSYGHIRWVSVDFPWIVAIIVIGHVIGARRQGPAASALWRELGFSPASDEISGAYVRFSFSRLVGTYVVLLWIILAFLFLPGTTPFIYFQF